MRLRITGRIGEDRLRRVTQAYPGLEPLLADDGRPFEAMLAWDLDLSDVERALEVSPDLAWLHMRWAGVPADLLALLDGHPVTLTNGSGAHGPAIAEFVAAVLLSHFKRLPQLRSLQQAHEWPDHFRISELRGRSVGVVGLGDLGGSIARLLKAFGMRVLALRRQPAPTPDVDEVFANDQLDDLLPQLDVLVLAAPLTPETRGLIGAEQLARLPRGAYLVNVGRGALLDEGALLEALRSGHLSGAALDVFAQEPLPPDSPLWGAPNLTISPHCSDHTDTTLERALAICLDNLGRFLRHEPLLNVVDRSLGY